MEERKQASEEKRNAHKAASDQREMTFAYVTSLGNTMQVGCPSNFFFSKKLTWYIPEPWLGRDWLIYYCPREKCLVLVGWLVCLFV